jgi:hypothetical protein
MDRINSFWKLYAWDEEKSSFGLLLIVSMISIRLKLTKSQRFL